MSQDRVPTEVELEARLEEDAYLHEAVEQLFRDRRENLVGVLGQLKERKDYMSPDKLAERLLRLDWKPSDLGRGGEWAIVPADLLGPVSGRGGKFELGGFTFYKGQKSSTITRYHLKTQGVLNP